MSLDAEEREALELTIRHGMDTPTAALVLGISSGELEGILGGARVHLEQALAGEILARHGVHGCLERAEALQGWAGELTVPLRERLVHHARSCQVCGRSLPHNVSDAKVFSLLPVPVPPQAMRLRVMTCFSDPELAGYRMFAAARVTDFNRFGFPDDEAAPLPPQRRVTATAVWSGPAAAAVAVAVLVAAVFAISRLGGFTTAVQGVSSAANGKTVGAAPTVTGQASLTSPASSPGHRPAGAQTRGVVNLTTTQGTGGPTRLYLRGSSAPVPYRPSPGHSSHGAGQPTQLQVSPASLVLSTGSTGQLRLTASGGPVTWSAVTSSSDITLSSSGGTIAAGQQVVVTVDITRADNSSGQGHDHDRARRRNCQRQLVGPVTLAAAANGLPVADRDSLITLAAAGAVSDAHPYADPVPGAHLYAYPAPDAQPDRDPDRDVPRRLVRAVRSLTRPGGSRLTSRRSRR